MEIANLHVIIVSSYRLIFYVYTYGFLIIGYLLLLSLNVTCTSNSEANVHVDIHDRDAVDTFSVVAHYYNKSTNTVIYILHPCTCIILLNFAEDIL